MPDPDFYTHPAEANYRLEQLSKLMAELAAAALGRGVHPLVSEGLAAEVALEQSRYLEWRQSIGGWELVTTWAPEMQIWEGRANQLRAKILAEGQKVPNALTGDVPELPGPPSDIDKTIRALGDAAGGLGMLVAGLGIAYVLSQRKGR